MSTEIPGTSESERLGDDDAVFDDLARRAGAALRRPAPEDGMRDIAARRRRQQARKAATVGGVAVVTLIGVLIIANRDDPDNLPPVGPVPVTTPTALTTNPSRWVEPEPGASASLPPAPVPARLGQALVWTGSEFIVWGGFADYNTPQKAAPDWQEGAAFDPAAGTWRPISPPPDRVRVGVALWTGSEMVVWNDGTAGAVSAAYNPATDTWREIADPPVRASAALWIGDAAVVLPDLDLDDDGFVDSPTPPTFAYDPVTDEWCPLADGPWGRPTGWVSGGNTTAVWTGTTIITMTDSDSDAGIALNSYDPVTDTWRALDGLDEVRQMVVIPGRSGAADTVALLPLEPGTPVKLLDDRGNAIGELSGRPAELALTCDRPDPNEGCLLTFLRAASVGGEVLFWNSGDGWAFDPNAQTWRSFPLDGRQPGGDGTEVVAAGDLLFAWGDDRDGLVYRAATPP